MALPRMQPEHFLQNCESMKQQNNVEAKSYGTPFEQTLIPERFFLPSMSHSQTFKESFIIIIIIIIITCSPVWGKGHQ